MKKKRGMGYGAGKQVRSGHPHTCIPIITVYGCGEGGYEATDRYGVAGWLFLSADGERRAIRYSD